MNIISNILSVKNTQSSCALIPFITAGFPDTDMTINTLYALDQSGADIIELGIPYADALADGPIIQHASKVAIDKGVYIDQVLDILQLVTNNLKAPIIVFTYYNPILVRGINKFITEIAYSGAKGLIIPDLPIEETDYIVHLCNIHNLELVLFIAPTSSINRITKILSKSPGCLYLVSSTGVTGTRDNINKDIIKLAKYIKSKTNKLIMLGFGISNINQVNEVSHWNIDGIVIGSAFIKLLSHNEDSMENIKNVESFCSNIKFSISNNKYI